MDSNTLRSPIKTLNPSKPTSVHPDTPTSDVIKTMQDNAFGCVLVEENDRLVGIFTERDVLTKIVGSGLDPQKTKVREVMTLNPEYLFDDDEIAFALNRMHVGGFRHIPLINLQGKPTGIISLRDISDYLLANMKPAEN